jgi:hypothetical protein
MSGEPMDWYLQSIQSEAPWSFGLLFVQVVLLSMLLERTLFVVKGQVNITMFLAMLKKLAAAGNVDRAILLTKALDAPAGRVCRAGLEALGNGPFVLTEELDRAIAKELPLIQRRLGAISALALAAIAVGVIGSVLSGAGAPAFGGTGPLPFGLAEEHALALVGVPSGVLGLLWGIALASKAKRIVADLGRCKAAVLELGGSSPGAGG